MDVTVDGFPKYPYTFLVVEAHYERGMLEVKYMPNDSRFIFITYTIPIEPDFDPNNLTTYVDKWAPHDKWFAQDMLLQHSATLVGSGN